MSNEFFNEIFEYLDSYEIFQSFSILANLSSLPYLDSLTINIQYACRDLTEVYRLIFTLPKLKSIKCLANKDFTFISLPIANNEKFSPIQIFGYQS